MKMRYAVILLLLFVGAECAVQLNEPYGTIESANYPDPYPDNTNQTWILNTRPGYQIVVYFTTFDLEDSYDEELGGDCVYDYVELEHLGTRHRFCGKAGHRWKGNAPRSFNKFRSESNQMIINFVSDYLNEDPRPIGFQAHFYHDDKDECAEMSDMVANTVEDWDDLIYCDHFCVNVPGSYYCSCRHGYVLHSNQHTCTGDCRNEMIQSDNGLIQTPEYPSKYPKLTDCQWNIEVREGLSLNFNFSTTFDIEDHYNYTDCPYDFLKLAYGDQEAKFCGSVAPAFVMTNTRIARLEFHTDNAVEKAGFQVSYTTTRVRCNEHPQSPSNGQILSNITETRGYYEFEDVVKFKCDDGYNLVGMQHITCQSDGNWNGGAPICQIKTCADPVHLNVPYSSLIGASDSYTYTQVVSVSCNNWYELVSGTERWVCNKNSEWVAEESGSQGIIPECKPVCGEKNFAQRAIFSQHISGGLDAKPHEWPWMAFINIGLQPNVIARSDACGGFLIGPDHVLTAAHCITKKNTTTLQPLNQVFVWLGVHNRKKDHGPNTKARSYPVIDILKHPDYNNNGWDSDLALLRLATTVVMDDDVRPICLPLPDSDAMDFGNGLVAGWGVTEKQFGGSVVLKFTELPIVNHTVCWQNFLETVNNHNREMPSHLRLTENMFCAGVSLGSQKSTCTGDSGGPFMTQTPDDKFRAYGIVSWGISLNECGESLSYSVFTDLHTRNVQWIKEQIL